MQAVSLGMSIKAFTSVGYYNAELYDRVADYFVDRMDCLKFEVWISQSWFERSHLVPFMLEAYLT